MIKVKQPVLGRSANPRWQAQFVDKKLFDEQGNQKFKIYKGSSAADKEHGADGLSGATLTSNGVQGSFDYWFSQNGFGPFLAKFKSRRNQIMADAKVNLKRSFIRSYC